MELTVNGTARKSWNMHSPTIGQLKQELEATRQLKQGLG